MDGMVINNLSAQETTECGLLQHELLKSFVEAEKQKGITEGLMKRLASKKIDAISDMYGNVHVTNEKFGECGSDFYIDATADRITLSLKYYVYRIPLDGLSNHDKRIAKRYNYYVCNYDTANNVSSGFKTFFPWGGLTGSCDWSYSIDDILKNDFLTEGISVDNAIGGMFKVFLK